MSPADVPSWPCTPRNRGCGPVIDLHQCSLRCGLAQQVLPAKTTPNLAAWGSTSGLGAVLHQLQHAPLLLAQGAHQPPQLPHLGTVGTCTVPGPHDAAGLGRRWAAASAVLSFHRSGEILAYGPTMKGRARVRSFSASTFA